MKKYMRRLTHNFQYKISALFLATMLWYLVQGEEILDINRRLIVNIEVPDDLMIKGAADRIKDVTLRGPRAVLGDFPGKAIEATLTVPKGKTGQLRYRINKDFIPGWDNRIKMTVHDPVLVVFVDEKLSKTVPVKEYTKGVPADGYIIEKVTIKPDRVAITGLKSEVARINEVLTEPIDVQGIQQSKSFEVSLVPNGFTKDGINVDKVTVSLLIGEKKINKRLQSIPVEVVGSEYLSTVTPRYVSIVIQGTPGVLSFVKRSDLEAFIEGRELEPGKKSTHKVQVKIPPDTVLIETVPETATVEIYNQKRLN